MNCLRACGQTCLRVHAVAPPNLLEGLMNLFRQLVVVARTRLTGCTAARRIGGPILTGGLALFTLSPAVNAQVRMPSVYAGYTYQNATLIGPQGPIGIWLGQPGELRGAEASAEEPLTDWFGLRLNVSKQRGSVTTSSGCEAIPVPCTPTPHDVTNTETTVVLGPTI